MRAAAERDPLLPPEGRGTARGAALAVAAHAALLLALTAAVNWRSRPAETVSAELWAAVPEAAAPAPPPPPPPPPPPAPAPRPAPPPAPTAADIALERAREQARADAAREAERQRAAREQAQREAAQQAARERERAAAERAEREKAERERRDEEARAAKAAQEKKARDEKARRERETREREALIAKQREATLKRLLGQGPTSDAAGSGRGARNAGPSASYAGRLIGAVRRNIVYTGEVPGDVVATVEVVAAPGGSVVSRRLVKSSGHADWDEAVLRAIDRTGALPRDTDGRVPSPVTIDFRFRD